jgi:hypothetical protein
MIAYYPIRVDMPSQNKRIYLQIVTIPFIGPFKIIKPLPDTHSFATFQ